MPQPPGVADHARPDSTDRAPAVPEPLVKAEAIRAVIALAVGAKWIAVDLPDPILDVVVDGAVGLVGLVVSFALTWVARGKVWAKLRGVDVDAVVDEVQRRTAR